MWTWCPGRHKLLWTQILHVQTNLQIQSPEIRSNPKYTTSITHSLSPYLTRTPLLYVSSFQNPTKHLKFISTNPLSSFSQAKINRGISNRKPKSVLNCAKNSIDVFERFCRCRWYFQSCAYSLIFSDGVIEVCFID